MIRRYKYLFTILLIIILFPLSCFNKKIIIPVTIHRRVLPSKIKPNEPIIIHLLDDKIIKGFVKEMKNDSLILESFALSDTINMFNQMLKKRQETKPITKAPYKEMRISMKEVKYCERMSSTSELAGWIDAGEKIAVLLQNSEKKKGVIYSINSDGLVLLVDKNKKLHFRWSEINQIEIIRTISRAKTRKTIIIVIIFVSGLLYLLIWMAKLASIGIVGQG